MIPTATRRSTSTRSSPGDPASCSCRASRTSSATGTSTSCATRSAPAVPVVRVDGRDLFWWGSRTPGAVSRLRAQLDPLIVPELMRRA